MQNVEDEENGNSCHLRAESPTPSTLLEVSISEGENKIELNPASELPQAVEVKTLKCSECSLEFANAEERRHHFNNKGKLPTVISPCPKCGTICPSECSSKAHKRLHLQISPYVCPECGDNPDRYWENFQRHLTYQCFHYARSLCYKCALCNNQLFISSPELLKQHSISNHTVIFYKCQVCPMAYTKFTNFQVHTKTHSTETSSSFLIDPVQMYECSVCDIVFLGKDDSDNHWDSHLKENICQYAYTCSECKKVLESKLSLRDHLRCCHLELFNKYMASLNLPHEACSSTTSAKDVGLNKSRVECLLCHGAFMTRQGHSLHVTKSHSNHKYPCGVCNKIIADRMTMISHGKEHLEDNISLCLLCQNKPMKSPDKLGVHLLNHVECVKHHTFCPICDTAIFTFAEALQHLRWEHQLPATDNQSSSLISSEETLVKKPSSERALLSSSLSAGVKASTFDGDRAISMGQPIKKSTAEAGFCSK